ncbi:sporulation protein YunB [Falsibacillus albus]|uniref:Sporulation protein YunB n=1 Tax=Falsibacillus albus TaxID=2478915 RepID=A0A3L7JVA8_9BACI|nr:sporulation protein YunB [Falsibacillus albus]RLQ94235.1 sporulation protein YunB [Falsibacillus albus]
MLRKNKSKFKRKYGPLPFRYVFLITFIFFCFSTAISLVVINKNIEPILMSIAETKATQFGSQAINDAISKKISENIDIDKLIVTRGSGDDLSYSFNPQIYNRVISEATTRVQKYLDLMENGEIDDLEDLYRDINIDYEESKQQHGIVYYVPLGMATKQTLFSNLGPKIPVKLEILGAVTSNVETKIVETGINNTYLEVYINVKIQMNVIIPLRSKPIEISNSVKIGDLFHPGKVPLYYNGGGGKDNFNPVVIPPGSGN